MFVSRGMPKMAGHISHFLRLPAELRTRIYELALTGAVTTFNPPTHYVDYEGRNQWKISIISIPPGLLLANKQLYTEALDTYYTYSTFRICPSQFFDTGGPTRCALEMLAFWLENIPARRASQIGDVVIDVSLMDHGQPYVEPSLGDELISWSEVRWVPGRWLVGSRWVEAKWFEEMRYMLVANGFGVRSGVIKYGYWKASDNPRHNL